jgi:diguanylate cyclase (GGDEF)-like protein
LSRYLGRWKVIQSGEALTIAILAVLLFIVLEKLDAFDSLVTFLARHEDWQLDEVFFVLSFSGVAALVVAIRRAADMSREIERREHAEVRATELARHDPLTGLPNRRVLHEELARALAAAAHAGHECAALMIDLDHFKPVNDLYGHDAGDAVLLEISTRLQDVSGASLIARVGGDEFVYVMEYEPGSDAPARMATQIIRSVSEPVMIDGKRIEVGATIGIARCPVNASDPDELLRAADVAMYDAKRAGRGGYCYFRAEMDERLKERSALEAEMRDAIERGDITAFFQPVIDLTDRRIVGFEALARWNHPVRGLLMPDTFIPIAEDLGLIGLLSTNILREGCIAARDWPDGTTLSVNISPVQLQDPWLSARLLAVLTEHGFAPSRLIVEITENAIIDDIDLAAEVFASLQNAGIRIALDDFGKGYSSLSHLRQLRFNHLKIDSSFVRSMDSAESQKIVSAVAGLGKALGMPVTAEGVETIAVADALSALGCEQAQGFLFGRPLSATDTVALFALAPDGVGELLGRSA